MGRTGSESEHGSDGGHERLDEVQRALDNGTRIISGSNGPLIISKQISEDPNGLPRGPLADRARDARQKGVPGR